MAKKRKANSKKRMADGESLRRQIVEPRLEELAVSDLVTAAGALSTDSENGLNGLAESAPQQAEQRESESAEELPYTVGWWKGLRQWNCKLCPWDTLESEAAMLEHIAVVHRPPPSPILIADKRGRVINRE